jgi:two-component system phosphate regulon sensor histidine kinase PhoR
LEKTIRRSVRSCWCIPLTRSRGSLNASRAAAWALFRLPAEGARLVSAFRHPQVLEAIDGSLFGGLASEAFYEPRGAQERIWRVRTTPLDDAGSGARMALVHFRDETDARRADKSRVDFLANASHELRTPLASLSGFIETLRGHAREDPEAREQFLRIMTVQAERMRRLIDDLMSLSRIELNEHVPPSGSCDLALAVMDVVDALKPMTAEKSVALELKLAERGAAEVAGDRYQIVQVAQNLIDNAVKYSPAGTAVTVEVRQDLTALEASGIASPALSAVPGAGRLSLLTPDRPRDDIRYVLLRVTDTGPGMAREHLPRLAERFYRVEGQKSGERLGTGLGLAIAKHVMNRHRGGLIVESAVGFGTAFSAYFPAA